MVGAQTAGTQQPAPKRPVRKIHVAYHLHELNRFVLFTGKMLP